ncbi:MAG: hypothetical protein A2Y23_06570 [Clostridiales bacterium GWB2_37_7]|nr:MAG: hypothetical protein A2Y23_06570 [Clostridiales bacterium GWB2_37_7]
MKNSTAYLIIVMVVISLASGLVLALTYNFTIPSINEIAAREQEQAILAVIPGATKYETYESAPFPMYKGIDDSGSIKGVAYVIEGGGFQGIIKIMVGIDMQNQALTGIKILSHSETPGLGARITEDWFQSQFAGKSINDAFVARQDVEAITGATISTKAVSRLLKESIPNVVEQYKTLGGGK